jgi:cadmium resistance protein CadD (predicted permease)
MQDNIYCAIPFFTIQNRVVIFVEVLIFVVEACKIEEMVNIKIWVTR